MSYEQKDMTGALFINDRREHDKHPNAKGSCVIDGKKYWISAWTNTAQSSGAKYQSLKFELAEDRQTGPGQKPYGQHRREQAQQPRQTTGYPAPPLGGGAALDESDIPFAPDRPDTF